ncbi:hypothetical protein WME76_02085 [Sorangium sp. So ce119]|uniref:hypothetical protein n=1 Tax=Sorangium sp. So ce119 TaxID=3133279 RepID=UPI003F61FE3A
MSPPCGSPGPRGLRCQRPTGHAGRHHAVANGPAEPCDMCEADAGEDCREPAACERARNAVATVLPLMLPLWSEEIQ